MAQTLTVHMIDQEWIARDVTGSSYGKSADLFQIIDAAERPAGRIGATVSLSRNAESSFDAGLPKAGTSLTGKDADLQTSGVTARSVSR